MCMDEQFEYCGSKGGNGNYSLLDEPITTHYMKVGVGNDVSMSNFFLSGLIHQDLQICVKS